MQIPAVHAWQEVLQRWFFASTLTRLLRDNVWVAATKHPSGMAMALDSLKKKPYI